jgi:hypothetical protein
LAIPAAGLAAISIGSLIASGSPVDTMDSIDAGGELTAAGLRGAREGFAVGALALVVTGFALARGFVFFTGALAITRFFFFGAARLATARFALGAARLAFAPFRFTLFALTATLATLRFTAFFDRLFLRVAISKSPLSVETKVSSGTQPD